MIGTEQQVSASFKKRDLVITTDEQYPQHILVEFTQDKCDLLNGLSVGQEIDVHINIRGREWVSPQGETKYFNSIQGWRVEKGAVASEPVHEAHPIPLATTQQTFGQSEPDDLPF